MSEATGIYIGGQKIDFDLLSYDMQPKDPPPGAAGIPRAEYVFETEMTTSLEAAADLRALFDATPAPSFTRIQWDEGFLFITLDVRISDTERVADAVSMSLCPVPGGLSSVVCGCCGHGRAYASSRRALKSVQRWRRHVCPRGAK